MSVELCDHDHAPTWALNFAIVITSTWVSR
jgi:hypothetical protein